jgi:CheY-like chemotaxis protein
MLTKLGYTVLEAENGEIVLEIIDEGEVDLAIVDIMMPTMGGLELR